jgi:serine/threonine-protein kinase
MGEVYRARDERLQRDVALKVLPPGILNDAETRERLRQEALTLSRLNHPHVATLHDFDTQDGVDFLVMEFVPGISLSDRLVMGPLAEKEAVKLGLQVATALGEAHEQGVVHRDLKPGNIMVTPKGQAKVLDFGLAKLVHPVREPSVASTGEITEHNVTAGTLPYMAPEQLTGELVDVRTDIYALGAVLYEMATGHRPYREPLAAKMIDSILHEPPVPPRARNPRVTAEFERITMKCLEKSPENRYQSAVELVIDLRRLEASTSGIYIPQARRRRGRPKGRIWGMAVVLAAVALAVGLNVRGLRDRLFGAPPSLAQSVAVLPIPTPPGQPEQEYFADGMHDALISELTNISAMRVIPRTSMMRYKESRKSITEIARELKVDSVLEATVLLSGERVRINAQLFRGANEARLWGESYERNLSDVLSLQREVASAVAREVRVALTPREAARLARAPSVNPDCYVAYVRGKFYLGKRGRDDVAKGIELFQLAITKDPSYAAPYVGLADGYLVLWGGAYLAPDRAYPLAEAAAKKALELDEASAEAHTSLASVRDSYYQFEEADQEYRRAIELNPNYATAHHWYALYLSAMGRHAEALEHIQRAQQLDPLSLAIAANAGWCRYLARQYDQAIDESRKALELDPNFAIAYGYMGQAYVEKGLKEEAVAAFRKARELSGDLNYDAELASAYAVFGHRAEAQRLLTQLKASSAHEFVADYSLALVYASLGDRDRAMTRLQRSYENHESRLMNLRAHPRFEALHSDQRFTQLVHRMGFP